VKIIIIQTIIVIEDDNKPESKRQPPVDPFLELIQRFQLEMARGRDVRKIREKEEHGPFITQ